MLITDLPDQLLVLGNRILASIGTFYTFVLLCVMLQKELAKLITLEQGKTLADAEGDVFRGLRKSKRSSFKGQSLKPGGRLTEMMTCSHAFVYYR